MVVIAKHQAQLEQFGLATPAQVKNFKGERVKDHRGRRDIFKIATRDSSGKPLVLFLKRNWKPYKKDGLTSLFMRGKVWSQSRREWENSLRLGSAGLRTCGLVAYGEECGLLWEKFSFLITETAAGETLDRFIRNSGDPKLRRAVFGALALEIRKMHDDGLATPDLFTRHVFVEIKNGAPGFCFIDMARLNRRKKISDAMRARDLAALNVTAPLKFVSAKERIRFLNTYAGDLDRKLVQRIAARVKHLVKRRKFRTFAD